MRDLPEDIAIAGRPNGGALHPFEFRGGSCFRVIWKQSHPLYWPDPTLELLEFPFWFVEQTDGGIRCLESNRHQHVASSVEATP